MSDDDTKDYPPMSTAPQCYQWKRGDAWRVGVQAIDTNGDVITRSNGGHIDWLMKVSHSSDLEWVWPGNVSNYPPNNVKIEEPTK